MNAVCANPNCDRELSPRDIATYSKRCGTCGSYLSRCGAERPRGLCLWPGAGHPLATTHDLCDMLEVTYRQIDYLCRVGKAVPTIDADGSGTRRGFDLDGAVAAAVAMCLTSDVDPPTADRLRDAREWVVVDEAFPWLRTVVDVAEVRRHLVERWPEGRELFLPEDFPVEVSA